MFKIFLGIGFLTNFFLRIRFKLWKDSHGLWKGLGIGLVIAECAVGLSSIILGVSSLL